MQREECDHKISTGKREYKTATKQTRVLTEDCVFPCLSMFFDIAALQITRARARVYVCVFCAWNRFHTALPFQAEHALLRIRWIVFNTCVLIISPTRMLLTKNSRRLLQLLYCIVSINQRYRNQSDSVRNIYLQNDFRLDDYGHDKGVLLLSLCPRSG